MDYGIDAVILNRMIDFNGIHYVNVVEKIYSRMNNMLGANCMVNGGPCYWLKSCDTCHVYKAWLRNQPRDTSGQLLHM